MALALAAAAPAWAQDREALERELKEIESRRAEILRQLGEKAPEPAAPAADGPTITESIPRRRAHVDDTLLGEVEVVATRWETERGSTPPLVDIVDGEWFDDREEFRVSEGLRHVPGVTVSRAGGMGSRTSVFLRGASATQTLVLQDGMPLNDPTTGGGFDFFDVDALNLERVEVLRGSYGVLYGSDAIGGVINLVTKRGDGPASFRASGMVGSFNTHRETLSGSGGDDDGHWSFGAAYTNSQNHGDNQDFDSSSFSGRFGGRIGTEGTFDVYVRFLDSTENEPFDFGNPLPPDENITLERELLAIGTQADLPLDDDITLRLRASVTDIDSHFRNEGDLPATAPEFISTSDATTTLLGFSGHAVIHDGGEDGLLVEAIAGFDHEREESVNYTDSSFGGGLGMDDETQNRGTYGMLTARWGDLVLLGGVRHDDHTLESESSPQVSGQYRFPGSDTTVRANYGEGFRAPTPIEFADPFSGNPDLKPETSESVDVGVSQGFMERFVAEATWFRVRTDDLIAYDFGTARLENLGRSQNDGYELALRGDLGHGLTGRAAYTHQRPRNKVTGALLTNRPEDFAALSLTWEKGDWTVTLDGYWQGSVFDPGIGGKDADLRAHAGRRTQVDLGAKYRISESLTAFGKVMNVLDEDYVETPTSAKALPLGAFIGIAWEF
jgi:vitamin B12 transporter